VEVVLLSCSGDSREDRRWMDGWMAAEQRPAKTIPGTAGGLASGSGNLNRSKAEPAE